MIQHTRFSAKTFSDLENASFSIESYSKMKFGCDRSAREMGYDLAESFFKTHAALVMSNRAVVIPSPYNIVPNAATIMTKHFVNRLNHLLVEANGTHVEYSIVHRKVSYVNDYGFLSKKDRKGLIDNDSFYLNRDFLEDKLLIFIDDVRITGTHEEKLVEILQRDNVTNPVAFLYFATYQGTKPDIEAALNFAGVANIADYVELSKQPNHHVIVRPLKYILSQKTEELERVLSLVDKSTLDEIYYGCLAEGYYTIPSYQRNFAVISQLHQSST